MWRPEEERPDMIVLQSVEQQIQTLMINVVLVMHWNLLNPEGIRPVGPSLGLKYCSFYLLEETRS